jgi:hypothetical protein
MSTDSSRLASSMQRSVRISRWLAIRPLSAPV